MVLQILALLQEQYIQIYTVRTTNKYLNNSCGHDLMDRAN